MPNVGLPEVTTRRLPNFRLGGEGGQLLVRERDGNGPRRMSTHIVLSMGMLGISRDTGLRRHSVFI